MGDATVTTSPIVRAASPRPDVARQGTARPSSPSSAVVARPPRRRRDGRHERRAAVVMVAPTVVLVAAVAFFPVVHSLWLSVHDSSVAETGGFVGLANYADLIDDADFREAAFNTVVFTAVSVGLELLLATAIAVGLNRRFRGRGLARTAILLPWAFPVVVSALMWRLMLQDQVGIVTYLAQSVGAVDGSILSERNSLMVAAILVDVWKETPFMALLILAGLQTIPDELTQAAMVDGAGAWYRFAHVTLPLVRPALLVAVFFRTLQAWGVYDLFWVMSDRRLKSLSTYVYEGVRVSQLDFATGTAAAVVTFLGAIAIALVFLRGMRLRSAVGPG